MSSVKDWVENIFIVDSYSDDSTLEIASKYTKNIYQHQFETHNKQWEWALKILPLKTDWVFGLDSDQKATDGLLKKLRGLYSSNSLDDIDGIYVNRKYIFIGRWIKHGGFYPKYLLKIFRKNKVFFERHELVDHHFYIEGNSIVLEENIIEENLKENDLSFWIQKQTKYAKLFAEEYYDENNQNNIAASLYGTPDQRTKFMKGVYYKLPMFVRSLLFFLYRYFLKLGFLDGKEGLIFHFLHGFWFRFLVDAEIYEMGKERRG